MANIRTASGTRIFIGPSQATTPADAAAYAGLTWTEIGMVRTTPSYGDSASVVTGAVVGDGRMRKAKASRDAGDTEIVVYPDPVDVGQAALVAAEATNLYYPIKIINPDRLNATGTDGIDYFMALITSKKGSGGDNDALVTRTFGCAVTSGITEVAPTAGS
jgi:hypothetical protein